MIKLLEELKQYEEAWEKSSEITKYFYELTCKLDNKIDEMFIDNKLYIPIDKLYLLEGQKIYNISLIVNNEIVSIPFVDGCIVVDNHILSIGKGEELKWDGTKYVGWLEDDFNNAVGYFDVEIGSGEYSEDNFESDWLDWTERKNLIKYSYKDYIKDTDLYINFWYIPAIKTEYSDEFEKNPYSYVLNKMELKQYDQLTEVQRGALFYVG